MEFEFTCRHIKMTPALKTFAQEKFERLDRRFAIKKIKLILEVQNLTHSVKGILSLEDSELIASGSSEDMYAAMDLLVNKLTVQLIKLKDKTLA